MTYKYPSALSPSWVLGIRSAPLPSSLRKQHVHSSLSLALALTVPQAVRILPSSPHLTLLTPRVVPFFLSLTSQCRCSVKEGSPFMTSFNWYSSFQSLRCCGCCCGCCCIVTRRKEEGSIFLHFLLSCH